VTKVRNCQLTQTSNLMKSSYYITLKYFKCPRITETAKALGLSMLNNTSHAGKETENKYVFKRERKTGSCCRNYWEMKNNILTVNTMDMLTCV